MHNFKAFHKDIKKKDKVKINRKEKTKYMYLWKKCGIKIQESSKIILATKNFTYIYILTLQA